MLYIKGPFTVRAGSSSAVTFRNVFAQTLTFQFYVDNPLFHISKSSESIRSHKEHKIVVSYDGSSSSKAPVAGRLVVSCARSAPAAGSSPAPPNIQWIYYLKGVAADGKDAKWQLSHVCSICAAAELVSCCCDDVLLSPVNLTPSFCEFVYSISKKNFYHYSYLHFVLTFIYLLFCKKKNQTNQH